MREPITTRYFQILMIAICMTMVTGCQDFFKANQDSQNVKISHHKVESNVTGVAVFYDGYNPFLWSEDKSKACGILIKALYLIGPEGRGVFGDGVINPKLYVAEKSPDGGKNWKFVKEWRFDINQAMRYRSKKQTVGGWGYLLPLPWGDEDYGGREIRMIVTYQRSDGISFSSSKKDFRVPVAGM